LNKLPNQTRSIKLASNVIKTVKAGLYESILRYNICDQSQTLFDAFTQLCQEKFIDSHQLFMNEVSDNFAVLAWTQTITQQYLSLSFESFDYNLFLEVMNLPLMGFKSLEAFLFKDSRTTQERCKTLLNHKKTIGCFLQFLQQLGAKSYFAQKFKHYDTDEFYEQWIANMMSLNLPKVFINFLFALKDKLNSISFECDLFIQILELLHAWSENTVLVNIFKIEFHGKALTSCQDKNIAPSNLEGVLLYLMRDLALNSKQDPEISKNGQILQLISKTLVLIQKIRANLNR